MNGYDLRTDSEKWLDALCDRHEDNLGDDPCCLHETVEGDDGRVVQECCLCRWTPCDRARQ